MESPSSDHYNIASRCRDLLGSIDPAINAVQQIKEDANLSPTNNEATKLTARLEALRNSLGSMYQAATGRKAPPVVTTGAGPPPTKRSDATPSSLSIYSDRTVVPRATVPDVDGPRQDILLSSVPDGIGRSASDTLDELSAEILHLLNQSPSRFGEEPLQESLVLKGFSIGGRALQRNCDNLEHAAIEVRLWVKSILVGIENLTRQSLLTTPCRTQRSGFHRSQANMAPKSKIACHESTPSSTTLVTGEASSTIPFTHQKGETIAHIRENTVIPWIDGRLWKVTRNLRPLNSTIGFTHHKGETIAHIRDNTVMSWIDGRPWKVARNLCLLNSIISKLPKLPRSDFTSVRYVSVFIPPKEVSKHRYLRWDGLRTRSPVALLVSVHLNDLDPAKAVPVVLGQVCGTLDTFSTVDADPDRVDGESIPFRRGGWTKRALHLHFDQYPTGDAAEYLHELGVRPVMYLTDSLEELPVAERPSLDLDDAEGEDIQWHIIENSMQLRLVKQNISAPGHSEKQLPYRAVRPSPVADPIQVIITTGTPGYIQAKNPDFYTECRQAVHALLKVDVCVHGDCETARYLTPRGLRRTFDKYVQFPAGGNVRVEIPAEELYQRFELPQMPSFSRLLKQIPVSKPGEYRLRRGGTL